MLKTVVREHHWPPEVFGGLFIDYQDHLGLEFWYNDIDEVNKELTPPKKK